MMFFDKILEEPDPKRFFYLFVMTVLDVFLMDPIRNFFRFGLRKKIPIRTQEKSPIRIQENTRIRNTGYNLPSCSQDLKGQFCSRDRRSRPLRGSRGHPWGPPSLSNSAPERGHQFCKHPPRAVLWIQKRWIWIGILNFCPRWIRIQRYPCYLSVLRREKI